MFRYSDTNKVASSKETQFKVVTKQRTVTYIHSSGLIAHGFETVEERVIDPENPNKTPVQIVGHKTIEVQEPVKRKKKKDEEFSEEES
jgi:hypothetical protein